MILKTSQVFLEIWLDAAFWTMIGLILAGLLKSFTENLNISRFLHGNGLIPAIKATILGVPIPLCSCGIIPVAVGVRNAGASKSATIAFLISTPETGVDSIAVSYALLGPIMTATRVMAAIFSALSAAALVLFLDSPKPHRYPDNSTVKAPPVRKVCCPDHRPDTCDSSGLHHAGYSLVQRLWEGQRCTFTAFLDGILGWLILGLLLSSIISVVVPYDSLASVSQGPWAMIIMAIIGLPLYVCASSSTLLAASLIMAGVSPGAVLVFLLSGPATNIATLGVILKELGPRSLACYLTGITGTAISCGYLINYATGTLNIGVTENVCNGGGLIPSTISRLSAFLFTTIICLNLCRRGSALLSRWFPTH